MNIVIIGYGGMGSYHVNLLKEYVKTSPEYPINPVGIYDIDKTRMEYAEKNGLKVYGSADKVWADKTVDAVLIATPNDLHLQYVKAAAEAGKNIICEKPVALTSKQAEEMYDAAERAGVIFEVHQNRRWDPDFLTVKHIYENRLVGDAYCFESRVMGGNGIPGAWRKEKARGGGMMPDWGVHLIDQMFQMIKDPVESIYCEYSYIYGEEVEDGFNLTVNFQGGIKFRVVVATDCFRNLPRWQVYGTEGTMTIEDWQLNGGMTRVLVKDDENIVGIQAGNGFTRTMAPRNGDSVVQLSLPKIHVEPFAFYKNFAAACMGKEKALIKREEVVKVFRFMEAAERSAKENVVVKF